MIFLCANVRLRVEREEYDKNINHRRELNVNERMTYEHEADDSDGDDDEQLDEDLTGIEYDGYLCFK